MNEKIFQIASVEIEQFATFPLPVTDSKRTQVDVNLDLTLNDAKRHINCSTTITMHLQEQIIIKLQVKCAYLIEQDMWNQWVYADSTAIPPDFVEEIANLTMATARGILYVKTENTKHNTYLVPVFDFKGLLQGKQK